MVRKGEVHAKVSFCSPADTNDCIEVDALVDTGSTRSHVTPEGATRLRLPRLGKRQVETTLGTTERELVGVWVDLDGSKEPTGAYIGPTYLIGLVDLEARGLSVNPSTGRLIHVPVRA